MGVQISEYIIKLGTEIDNSGFQQILKLLDSSKLKALGITAALSAATTAVYKYVEASTKQEFELRKLQKTKHKNIEQLRAEETALKVMGMTLKDIQKDQNLNKIYKDLVAFNKELEMPNMDKALKNVRELQGAFWKAKTAINYAVQAIGDKILINLEAPIKRITGGLGNISDWFKKNFEIITSRTAVFVTDFAKGVLGIFDGVKGIGKLVGKLPDSVKSVGTAVLAVWAIVQSGPLGRILALITAIGDITHDLDNYKANKQAGLSPGDKDYVQNLNDTLGIWDFIFGQGTAKEKARTLTEAILGGINEALSNFSMELDNAKIGSWFDEESGFIGQIFGGIKEYLTSEEGSTALGDLLNNLLDTALSIEGFAGRLGSDVIRKLGLMVGQAFGNENFQTGVEEAFGEDNTVATGVVTGITTALLTKGNIFASLAVGLSTIYKQALLEAGDKLEDETDGQYMMRVLNIATDDFGDFATGIFNMISGALATVNDTSGTLLSAIIQAMIKAIGGADKDTISGAISDAVAGMGQTDLFGALGTTLGTTIATGGNFGIGLLTGLLSYFSDLAQKVGSGDGQYATIWDALKADAGEFWSKVEDIWYGPLEKQADGSMGRSSEKGLGSIFTKLWEGDEDFMGLKSLFIKIGDKIAGWLTPVGDAIKSFFANLWIDLFNSAPDWLKSALNSVGIDPNKSTVTKNDNGTYTITSTTGESLTTAELSEESGKWLMENQENFAVKEGKVVGTNKLSGNPQLRYGPWGWAKTPWGANDYLDDLTVNRRSTKDIYGTKVPTIELLNGLLEQSGVQLKSDVQLEPDVDPKQVQNEIDKGKYTADVDVNLVSDDKTISITGGSGSGGGNVTMEKAWGGRIGSRTDNLTVGEDGTEYIIPITKPDRAFELIYEMINEMGSGAVRRLAEGLGIGDPGTIGSSKANLETAMTGMQMANTYNVSAPVTIYVNANGSDAKEIGNNVYDTAERHLLKNLGEVFA